MFDMLSVFLELRKDVEAFTADRANGLRDYELSAEEWDVMGELVEVLTVRLSSHCHVSCLIVLRC